MRIDLHNFFQYYDPKNPKHVAAVEQLELDLIDSPLSDDTSNWVRIFRTNPEKPKSNMNDNFYTTDLDYNLLDWNLRMFKKLLK